MWTVELKSWRTGIEEDASSILRIILGAPTLHLLNSWIYIRYVLHVDTFGLEKVGSNVGNFIGFLSWSSIPKLLSVIEIVQLI